MLRVGITGGIGSGKSTVARIFQVLDIPVYYADREARRLMNEDPGLRASLIRHFGTAAYDANGLNRSHIASVVFNDPRQLELLNSLVHPATMKDGDDWMKTQHMPYAIHEAALIFEAGVGARLDFIIGVSAPEALRIKRVMDRDGTERTEILKRMKRQIEESVKMKLCDAVIINDEQQAILPQVLALHQLLLEKASSTHD